MGVFRLQPLIGFLAQHIEVTALVNHHLPFLYGKKVLSIISGSARENFEFYTKTRTDPDELPNAKATGTPKEKAVDEFADDYNPFADIDTDTPPEV